MNLRLLLPAFLLPLSLVACAPESEETAGADEAALRAPTAVVELALDANGKCVMKSTAPRVKLDRVVRLKNAGTKPIAALVELWDSFGGMPAPEGAHAPNPREKPGDFAPPAPHRRGSRGPTIPAPLRRARLRRAVS